MAFLAKTGSIDQAGVSGPDLEVSTGLTLTEPSRVFLNIGTEDIANLTRVGNDLVFSFCGDVITIAGFFLPEAPSQLFVRGADGEAVLVLLESIGADGEIIARFLPQAEAAPFESLTSSMACVIAPGSSAGLASVGAAVGAVLGGVGLLGAAANSGSSSSGGGIVPDLPAPRPPSFVGATLSADGGVLSLAYDMQLDATNPPLADSFVVLVDGTAVAVTAVRVTEGRVELTLAAPVPAGATLSIGYTDPTPGNDASAIQDAAGTDAASLAQTEVSNDVPPAVPPATPPAFLAAQTSTDGANVVLIYDQPLDAANPPQPGSFVVDVDGVAAAVAGVTIVGNTVVLALALAAPVPAGAAVTVAYADPTPGNDANAIQDTQGDDALGLAPTGVSNLVPDGPVPDGTAPAFVSAATSADGAALVLTYSEALDAANPPAAGSFVVNVGAAPVTVTGVSVVGATVVLTLAAPMAHGVAVTVAYADPSAGDDAAALQDTAGNDAASLPATSVNNLVPDASAPAFVSAATSIDGTSLVLTYSEALDGARPPTAGSFTVNVDGAPVPVTGLSVVGATVVLTLGAAVPQGAAVTVAYADPSAADDLAAVQDLAGNDAASLAPANVSNLVPDGTAPAFVSAATSADGATLVLSYDEALDGANPPEASSFVVNVNGSPVGVTAVAVSGTTVVLTLAAAVPAGAAVDVAYADATAGNDAGAIQDAAGNDAASLPATAVNNLVPDGIKPTFVSAATSADGAALVLTYDEVLDGANPPAASGFVVSVDGVAATVTGVAIAGSTVQLALATPIPHGALVTVAYGDPTPGDDANAIQDATGNDAASLAPISVANLVPDGSAPAFVSAATSADGTRLTLAYSETLDGANPPDAGSFLVTVDGAPVAVTSVGVIGSSVVLGLATPVGHGAAVTVAYTDPSTGNDGIAVQDAAGNDAASLPATGVTNTVPDSSAPTFASATTSPDGAALVLDYTEALDAANPPLAAGFVVNVDGAPVAVTGVAIQGSSVVLTLFSPVSNGAAVSVAYADPSADDDANAIQDAAGNDAASLPATVVVNTVPDTLAPTFVSATTSADGATLVLSYDEALDGLRLPAAGSFVVNVNGVAATVTGVSAVGSTLVLALDRPVASGAAVTVAYADPTPGNDVSAIQDASGNDAASLPATAVDNIVPDTRAPGFVSAVTSTDGAALVLTYSEALDAARPPAADSFVVNVDGAPVAVTAVTVQGSTLALTLATPVPPGVAVGVAYADPTADNDAAAIQDAAGNDAASLAATGVDNTVPDTTPPVFFSAATSADGATLTLAYSEALDAANPPAPGSFSVTANGAAVGVTGVAVVGSSVVLTLATPVATGAVVSVTYADPTGDNDAGAVQDAAGNDAASLAPTAVSNLVPDSSAPTFVSAVTSADGATLVLSYSEALDAVNVPPGDSFVVNADGVQIPVAAVTVVGSTVVLTLGSPVANGSLVTVAYADPSSINDSIALQDLAGNDAASLPATGVDNAVPDTTAPVLVSAATSTDGTTLALNYSEALDPANLPPAASFTVSVDGALVAVTNVAALGSTVVLTLGTAVASGAAVTVAYADATPDNDPAAVQDAVGNDAASLPATIASNLVPDGTAPAFVSAATSADGGTLVLTYDDLLDAANPPGAGSFSVNIDGIPAIVTGASVAGATVLLTLATPVTIGAAVTVAYTDPTVDNDSAAIQDAVGNDAASFADTAVTNLVPNGIAPTFVSAATTTDGSGLVLTYDNLLDPNNPPSVDTFEVRVNGALVAVQGTAVTGSTIELTLAAAIPQGAGVTVAYVDPTPGDDLQAIQDTAGNDAASLPLTGVSNQVADTAAPTFVSAVTTADGAALVLTYNEALDPADPPTAERFAVTVNGAAVAVTGVVVSGSSVQLALASPVAHGARVTVGYGDPTPGDDTAVIQDTAGNDAASLAPVDVSNTVPDSSAPVFVSAVTRADGGAVVLSYNEVLDPANPPLAGSFVVSVNGVVVGVTGVAVTGNSVSLALAAPVVHGAAVTVAYADPTPGNDGGAIQDAAGNDAASLAPTPVNNTVPDTLAPTLVSAVTSVDGASVVLTYSEALDPANAPLAASFVVNANGVAVPVTAVAVSGNAVLLTLAAPVANGALVTVAYGDPTPGNDALAIQDRAGNDAASLAQTGVFNAVPDNAPPAFVSAVTRPDGTALVLTYDEALDAANPPAPGSFLVRSGGVPVDVESVAIVGRTVVLTLSSPLANGAAVTVAYGDPTAVNDANAIQDTAGNDAASLAETAVNNTVPDTTPPAFVSAATSANGAAVVLSYDEALDPANPPAAGSFVVNVDGVPVAVTALAVAGSTVVLTLATPVANGAAVNVSYADPGTGNDASAVQDAAGNDALSLAAVAVTNLVPDTLAPRLLIEAADLQLASGEMTAVTFSFSEPVAGFAREDVVLAGGTLSGFTQVNATTWTASFTQDGSSTPPSIGVASGAFTDLARNPGVGYTLDAAQGLTADIAPPTLLITAADLQLTSGETTAVTFSFSEPVAGFALEDVVLAGGTLSGFTQVNASTWTASFTQDGSSTPPSIGVAGGAFTDLARNPGVGYTLDASQGLTADLTPPTLLITAADLQLASGEATAITFSFSEPVSGFAAEDVGVQGGALSGFTQVNATTWTAVFTQDGSATPPSVSVAAGAYADIASNPGAAYALDAGAGFTADVAAPQLQSISTNAEGLEITLVYDEPLDAGRLALPGSFEVRVNGAPVPVSTVAVSGNSLVLGLATAVVFGDSVTLAYADPSAADDARATQDTAGNDAASFTAQPVANAVPSVDTTAPTLLITAADLLLAREDATDVTFEFSEAVLGFTADDVVVAGGALSAFTQIDANTWTAVFTQDGTATPPSVSVPGGSFTDAALNAGVGYVLDGSTGLVADIAPPALLSAATGANGATLLLTYSEALDAANPPTPGSFVVSANGAAVAVTSLAVSGSSVVLTLASPLANGATVTVGYNDPTAGNDAGAVQDLAGNDAASSAGLMVPDTRAPVLQGASVTGATLTLSFDEALGAAPPLGSFVVSANGAPLAVTGAVVAGSSVVLTLAGAVAAGAVVTVGYADPTPANDASAVQDLAGNDAASLAPVAVANTRALVQVDEDDIVGAAPAVASGAFAGVAANAALTLAAPPAGLTSGGQAIVWSGAGTSTLTGQVGSATGAVAIVVSVASGTAEAGRYTVSLLRPLDHGVANVEDLRNFNVDVLVNGTPSNLQLSVNVVDDVPVATPSTTQVLTAAGSVQGNAALTFGADGGYVQSVDVDGLRFSYNPAAGTLTQSGTSPSVYAYAYDNQSTLTVTTLRGETFSIDLANGSYSMLVTGVRASVPANAAPSAGLAESGALLGLVGVNALGLIDLSTQQAFTASDANNNIREVTLTLSGLSLGSLLRNPFLFSSTLAAELGLSVTRTPALTLLPQLRITSTTDGAAIDSLRLNELLGSISLDTGLLGALSLDVLSGLQMTVTDTTGLTDRATTADVLNLQLLSSLAGSSAPGLQVGTAGADVLSGSSGLAANASRRLYGYAGDDTLTGNLGNDLLRGGAGNDRLNGSAGNDLLIGGSGTDVLTGGQGVDVFRWENGDQGTPVAPVTDIITDFDVNSVWAGGDVLQLGALLNNEGRIGFTPGNLTNYLHFAKVGNDTQISISSQGGYVGGFNDGNSGSTDQQILLRNVDLVTGYGSDAAIITRLLGQGKLDVDSAALNGAGLDNTTDIGFGLVDRDGDTAAGSITFDTGAVVPGTFNPNNRAPEVQVASSSLLGLIGVDALNVVDLSQQDFSVVDRDRNLSQVEIRYQPLLTVSLTPIQLTASQSLAAELGLQLRVRNDPGVLNLLAPSSALVITSLVAGASIGNQAVNELLASVQLTDQDGTLLNGALLSADVINALTITATDTQGASSTAGVGQLLDVNLTDNVNSGANLVQGTNAGETLSGTTGADRLYGFDGDDTLLGGDGDDLLRGGAGNDTLDGGNGDDLLIGGNGSDTFIGGAGADTIELLSPSYASISGGEGFDTLLLDGGINLSLTTAPTRIDSIERIDLGTGDAGSVLTLSSQAVLELTDNPANTLQIVGDARDSVVMSGATKGATTVVGDVSFVSYAWGGATVLVEQEITNVVV